jgi:hypothetical protein
MERQVVVSIGNPVARARWIVAALILLGLACRPQVVPYQPSSIHVDRDGMLLLWVPSASLIHRYSPAAGRYLSSIMLAADSRHVAYSRDQHALYVAYGSGAIKRIALAESLAEQPFAQLPDAPCRLAVAGDWLFVGTFGYDRTLDSAGLVRSQSPWNTGCGTTDLVWNAAYARLHVVPGPGWRTIDPATGALGTQSGFPSASDFQYPASPWLRFSADGALMLHGQGHIFDAGTGVIRERIPIRSTADALWLDDGGVLTLEAKTGGGTRLTQWRADRSRYNVQDFPGTPLRVLPQLQGTFVVVTQEGSRPGFHLYVPGDDPDADGVANPDDRFPQDPSASLDSDRDGAPDAWNPGRGASDSTTGLALDAFPESSACQRADQGVAGVCDVSGSIPAYEPAAVALGSDDVAYLFSPENDRIYRRSLAEGRDLDPIVTGDAPVAMAYTSSLHRLYIAYATGEIRRIELAQSTHEQPFAVTYNVPTVLAAAGPHLLVTDKHSTYYSRHVFTPEGTRAQWFHRDRTLIQPSEWSAAQNRFYFLSASWYGDPSWESFDPITGVRTGQGIAPADSRGQYTLGPIRVKADGSQVLLGSGEMHDGTTLALGESLPIGAVDAAWLGDDVLTLEADDAWTETRLEHWKGRLAPWNLAVFEGTPLRVLRWSAGVTVLTSVAGRPVFHAYEPTDDADGDGVPNAADAFVLDPAASLDGDGDGAPDAWNPGRGPADSTAGLALDAFPELAACQTLDQATGGECYVAAAIPYYDPDVIVMGEDDVVYLLSRYERRIFRWSAAQAAPLDPIVLRDEPHAMAYVAASHRLHLVYGDGLLTRIDLASPRVEQPVDVLPSSATLVDTDGTLIAFSVGWRYAYDATALRILREPFDRLEGPPVWSSADERLYHASNGAPIQWLGIDPATGAITGAGEGTRTYQTEGVLRPSPDGSRIVLGGGDVADAVSLDKIGELSLYVAEDATWAADGLLTLRDGPNYEDAVVEQWSPDTWAKWSETLHPGRALRLLEWSGGHVVITNTDGGPAFHLHTTSDDVDGDGVLNPGDAFPADPAASEDTDGDAAPDVWNPGRGPGDSTTGLVLDAFPDDFACQIESHGVGGVCDFSLIVPPDPGQPLCSVDGAPIAAASGVVTLPAAADVVPLCDGWILYAETAQKRVVARNLVSGRVGLAVSLGYPWSANIAADLEVDPAGKTLYVSIPYYSEVVRLDLPTATLDRIAVPVKPRELSVAEGGHLLIATSEYTGSSGSRTLYHLAPGTSIVDGGWHIPGGIMLPRPGGEELVVVPVGGGPHVFRYAYDPASDLAPALIESLSFGAGLTSYAGALSPDGAELAIGADHLSGGSTIHHLSADALQPALGAWAGAWVPGSVAFDPTGTLLAAKSDNSLQLFDVDSHALVSALSIPRCSSHYVSRVAFSRGGAIALAKQECNAGTESRIHWLRID